MHDPPAVAAKAVLLKRCLAAFVFMTASTSLCAQIIVQPVQARPFEAVRVIVADGVIGRYGNFQQDQYDFRETRISMAGNKITVSLLMGETDLNLGTGPSASFESSLGNLPAGDYEVEVVRRAKDGRPLPRVGIAAFKVSERNSRLPYWDATGLWWSPQQAGNGVTVTQSGSTVFASWYVFGADRRATWFVVSDARWDGSSMFVGTIYRVTGPNFASSYISGSPYQYVASDVRYEAAGTAWISLAGESDRRMFLELLIDGQRYTPNVLERFAF